MSGTRETPIDAASRAILDAVKAELGAAWRTVLVEEDRAAAMRFARRLAEAQLRALRGGNAADAEIEGRHLRAQAEALAAISREAFERVAGRTLRAIAETAGALLRGFTLG